MQPLQWVFDLDNTLHDADHGIFPTIDRLMTQFICDYLMLDYDEAHGLRQHYYEGYGSTYFGLSLHYGVDATLFFETTHPTEHLLGLVKPYAHLHSTLEQLPGEKHIFSNGPQHYVEAICNKLNIEPFLKSIYGMDKVGLHSKPSPLGYLQLTKEQNLIAQNCIMVEDTLPNLLTAKSLGWTTIFITQKPIANKPDEIDYVIKDLSQLLPIAQSIEALRSSKT